MRRSALVTLRDPPNGARFICNPRRHVPDIPTLQALGFYWCNVTVADAAFFARISPGPPHSPSPTPARGDYPNCLTS